ncbi:hypothetical protein GW884_00080 [Candidatus Falkowbacteria bacterium]|nr:hypothetical protein [Candidatus Falkowbacteria bacterium]
MPDTLLGLNLCLALALRIFTTPLPASTSTKSPSCKTLVATRVPMRQGFTLKISP